MKKIPLRERCLYTEEVVSSFQDAPTLFRKDLDLNNVTISELIGEDKSLYYNRNLDDCEDLLEWFYSDKYINRPVARVNVRAEFFNNLRYLLVASNCINSRKENGKVIMKIEDIIAIPKSLYLLQLLEQENFSIIAGTGENISEQLELFDFSFIDSISLEELQKMDACGITKDAYSRTITKSDNDSHVLRLLKK